MSQYEILKHTGEKLAIGTTSKSFAVCEKGDNSLLEILLKKGLLLNFAPMKEGKHHY